MLDDCIEAGAHGCSIESELFALNWVDVNDLRVLLEEMGQIVDNGLVFRRKVAAYFGDDAIKCNILFGQLGLQINGWVNPDQ